MLLYIANSMVQKVIDDLKATGATENATIVEALFEGFLKIQANAQRQWDAYRELNAKYDAAIKELRKLKGQS